MPETQLKVVCPKGHKLACPADRAGTVAKCPKCGVRFRVPKNAEAYSEDETTSTRTPGEDEIVFLCPNNHRLHGPARLAGKAGQCPHCGEKFQIPPLEELTGAGTSDASSEEAPAGDAPSEEEIANAETNIIEHIEEIETVDEHSDAGVEYELDSEDSYQEEPAYTEQNYSTDTYAPDESIVDEVQIVDEFSPGMMSGPSIAATFADLWARREHDVAVRLHLTSEEVVEVHYYAASLSRDGFGMFAFKQEDGTFSLNAINWNAVARIELQGVDELPEEMYE